MKPWILIGVNLHVLPPQCTYDLCFEEALWIDPWMANSYCTEHKEAVIKLMDGPTENL